MMDWNPRRSPRIELLERRLQFSGTSFVSFQPNFSDPPALPTQPTDVADPTHGPVSDSLHHQISTDTAGNTVGAEYTIDLYSFVVQQPATYVDALTVTAVTPTSEPNSHGDTAVQCQVTVYQDTTDQGVLDVPGDTVITPDGAGGYHLGAGTYFVLVVPIGGFDGPDATTVDGQGTPHSPQEIDNSFNYSMSFSVAASFASVSNGVLTVNGTANADTISVTKKDANTLAVLENSAEQDFPLAGLTQISVSAGNGADTVNIGASITLSANINAGSGGDSITGGGGNDVILGFDGNDTLVGGAGNDDLVGFAGNDSMDGGAGNDTISYTDHSTSVVANLTTGVADIAVGSEHDVFVSIEGILGGSAADSLTGGAGNDSLSGNGGNDTLAGLGGNDLLKGGGGADLLQGAGGNDSLIGGGADDSIKGGMGFDSLAGGAGNDTLFSGADDDTLVGGIGQNFIAAGLGNDSIWSANGEIDTLFGGPGNDTYHADANDDLAGNDLEVAV